MISYYEKIPSEHKKMEYNIIKRGLEDMNIIFWTISMACYYSVLFVMHICFEFNAHVNQTRLAGNLQEDF